MLERPNPMTREAPQPAKPKIDAEKTPAGRPGFAALIIGIGAAALLGIGIYLGIRHRISAENALAVETDEAAVPIVDVIHPKPTAPEMALVLPGQTMAFTDTPIYARTNGYLKRWYFDIGAHVKKGQLLAEIETPELDEQLRQARAQVVQLQAAVTEARANQELAKVTNNRTGQLVAQGWRSKQQGDTDRLTYAAQSAAVKVAEANLKAQQAQVSRLEELTGFEKIVAPFDGVITARNTDIGDLINSGAGAPNTELFRIEAIKTLRIYVAVPEIYAPSIHVGARPTVTLDEYPGEEFHGTLVRTDNAINRTSRTLLVEVDVDNPDGKLLPGAYTFVHFTLPGRQETVTIPANTLLFRSEGLRVGVVRNGKAELVPIKIGRDYGDRVEVISGLTHKDQVILNPSDSLISGAPVRIDKSKGPGAV